MPRLIIIFDPSGRYPSPSQNVRDVLKLKFAELNIAETLEPATIAGVATQLGMMLLEQIVPPKPNTEE